MKIFKQSIIIFCLLAINSMYAPNFPSVQVAEVWIKKSDSDWAKILGVDNINAIGSRWPKFLEYIKNTPAPFQYLIDEKLKTRDDFENSEPTTLAPWLDEAINIVKSEEIMTNIPLEKQKEQGTDIINKLTEKLLRYYCDTNETLKNDDERKEVILGNAPIQIAFYLDKHWAEDWLTKASTAMQWTALTTTLNDANLNTVFKTENDPYVVNSDWLCPARKAAESDIARERAKKDPNLVAYLTQQKGYDSYPALTDARNKIMEKIIELISEKLTTEGKEKTAIADTIDTIKQQTLTVFNECIYREGWFGQKYTKKWENLTNYLTANKVNTTAEDVGILTTEWLNGAITEAKKDCKAEKIDDEVTKREAAVKIREAIPKIQGKDYKIVNNEIEKGLKVGWFG